MFTTLWQTLMWEITRGFWYWCISCYWTKVKSTPFLDPPPLTSIIHNTCSSAVINIWKDVGWDILLLPIALKQSQKLSQRCIWHILPSYYLVKQLFIIRWSNHFQNGNIQNSGIVSQPFETNSIWYWTPEHRCPDYSLDTLYSERPYKIKYTFMQFECDLTILWCPVRSNFLVC